MPKRTPAFFSNSVKWNLDFFTQRMQQLHYRTDDSGICHGISCVAAQAILLNDLTAFNQALFSVFQHRSKKRKREDTAAINAPTLDEEAFLQSIEICHDPGKFAHWFPTTQVNKNSKPVQHPLSCIPMIMCDALKNEGDVEVAHLCTGVYDLEELTHFFQSIRQGMEKFSHPAAIFLSNCNHIVVATYSIRDCVWHLVDSNDLPSKRYLTDAAIAKKIQHSLSVTQQKTIMSTMIFVTQQNSLHAKSAADFYTHLPLWKKMHAMTEVKRRFFPDWIYVAAQDGDRQTVYRLLKKGANIELPHTHEFTSLGISVDQGDYDIAELLLMHGADKNAVGTEDKTPLYTAVHNGREKIAQLLIRHGAMMTRHEKEKIRLENGGRLMTCTIN